MPELLPIRADRSRPRRLSKPEVSDLLDLIHSEAYGSLRKAASELAASKGISVSHGTVVNALRDADQAFRIFRRVPMLKLAHKAARVQFAEQNRSRDWSKVMFSDSKYFTLHSSSRREGQWQLSSAPRQAVGQPKHSPSVHVYMGVTAFGATSLVPVSGGSRTNSTFLDAKGKLYRGMCSEEYAKSVLPVLLSDGARLFSSKHRRGWVFQQDGARVHKPQKVKAVIAEGAPGGLLEPWPANSPDLSWIENIWAYMAAKARERPRCKNVSELLEVLEEIRLSLTPDILRPYVDSMPGRLRKCIEIGGATVK